MLLFLTQQAGSERIYFLNPGTGAVLGSIEIDELSAATGAVIRSFPAPEGVARGLT